MGYLNRYHYNFPKLEIYHYNLSILNHTIIISTLSKIYHYVPFRYVSQIFWTKLPSSSSHSSAPPPRRLQSASDGSATGSRALPLRPLLLPYDTLDEGFDLAAAAMAFGVAHTSFPLLRRPPQGGWRELGRPAGTSRERDAAAVAFPPRPPFCGRRSSVTFDPPRGAPTNPRIGARRPSIRREELRRIRGLEHDDRLGSSAVPDMASSSPRPGQTKRGRGKAEPRRWY
jgi:hypothetical protein